MLLRKQQKQTNKQNKVIFASQKKSMEQYNPKEIESKWQKIWFSEKTFSVNEDATKEKYYVLDMFPYPSGEGLHVGHPLGYIASDIFARYKTHKGYNVLHPMGYDSFGLPAEQYAIQTGQHPAITTERNIKRYRQQLDRLGFSFDWEREIRTSDPKYYKWTQWMFKNLFKSWYDKKENKAQPIEKLIRHFEEKGTRDSNAVYSKKLNFTKENWQNYTAIEKEKVLMNYRLAFLSESMVNWCPELGTVLANDEVKEGVSERGGYPVEQKKMMQWSLRISAYSQRLLDGLDKVDFTTSLKEQQKNWIGKSEGALITFNIEGGEHKLEVFTTRPDTIFGVSFMTLAPESELVKSITTPSQGEAIGKYIKETSRKSERERQANQNNPTGEFTGAYAVHPLTNKKIPIWISDYVLANYGTGAVMAVPAGDQRDHDFAKFFNLPIPEIFNNIDTSETAHIDKNSTYKNSDFLNDCSYEEAIKKIFQVLSNKKCGIKKVNYRLRDAIFSRQRYWGEPFPIYFESEVPKLIDDDLVTLPKVDKYLPTATGEPPLGRAKKEDWNVYKGDKMELNTMPGWAGSSWYFLRYMDPKNEKVFAEKEKVDYWGQVDLYVGGAEHAVGHLLYSRFWTKFLYDIGEISFKEPFKKLVNQGMIGGAIEFLLLKKEKKNRAPVFKCSSINENGNEVVKIPCHIDFVSAYGTKESHLNTNQIQQFINWRKDFKEAYFESDLGLFKVKDLPNNFKLETVTEQGKMSKRYFNTIDPEIICNQYGADTLRCYEMFLGPIEEHKPWNVNGISGVSGFLKKTWNLFHQLNEEEATKDQLKTLHKTIKKVTEDIEKMSLNTVVSTFMIAINEWTKQKLKNKQIFSTYLILLSPFAPHISEELWRKAGNQTTISKQDWPSYDDEYLIENEHEYPISFNGKMRFKFSLPLDMQKNEVESAVLNDERTKKYLNNQAPKRVIIVPGKIINIVI